MLIAIDPGLSSSGTGIAVFISGTLIETHYVAPQKSKILHDRVKPVVDKVFEILARYPGTNEDEEYQLVIEKTFYKFKGANELHVKFLGVLEYMFIATDYIAPTSVKKLITDNGRATKDDVMSALYNKYNIEKQINYDVSDAVAVGVAWYVKMGTRINS